MSEIIKDSKLDFLEKQIKAGLVGGMATMQDMQEFNNLSSLVQMGSSDGDKNALDKKTRREIANSNERRRMQSINTGFLRLKALSECFTNLTLFVISQIQNYFSHACISFHG